MADQKNRGGQKTNIPQSGAADQKRGTTSEDVAERSDQEKRKDQTSNPDDAGRQPTDRQR